MMTEQNQPLDSDLARTSSGDEPSPPQNNTERTQHSDARTLIGGSAANSTHPAVAGAKLGPFQILEKLGEGGMGTVYKARHLRLGKIIAVKILPQHAMRNPEVVSRFEREMLAVGQVQHPNVVQAHDAGDVDGVHYLAMEYVEGQDLQSLLKSKGRVSVQNACKIIRQATLGLAAAHQLGLVHRDLKPANLFITKSGQIKVLDLGLARLSQEAVGLTSTGECFGTPDYMAPEQWEDAHICDARTDLYALGCTLFCLLTGKPPFGTEQYTTAPRKMVGHVRDAIPDLQAARPDAPAELVAIYQRLLAKNPAQRIQSAAELAQLLAPFVKGPATYEATMSPQAGVKPAREVNELRKPAEQVTRKPVASRPPLIRWLLVSAALLAVAAIAAGILFQIETPAGTIVVEVDQPEISGATVTVDGQQKITIKPGAGQDPIEITADAKEHTLRVVKGGFETFTQKFTVKGGKEQRIHVRLIPLVVTPPKLNEPPRDPSKEPPVESPATVDRRVAAWVIKVGGFVVIQVKGEYQEIKKVELLPAGDFVLVHAYLEGNKEVNDENVATLRDAKRLTVLNLGYSQVTDKGLTWIGELTALEDLCLWHSTVTGATVKRMKPLTELRKVLLNAVPVDDQSLEALAGAQKLERLSVATSQLTDRSAAVVSKLTNLQELGIRDNRFSAEGIAQFAALKHLRLLELTAGENSDAEVAAVSRISSLTILAIIGPSIGAETLRPLESLEKLELLCLGEAKFEADAASSLGKFPQLRDLQLMESNIRDVDLTHLASLTNLTALNLYRTEITDEGLPALEKLKSLRTLEITGTKVTPAAIKKFRESLPNCEIIGP